MKETPPPPKSLPNIREYKEVGGPFLCVLAGSITGLPSEKNAIYNSISCPHGKSWGATQFFYCRKCKWWQAVGLLWSVCPPFETVVIPGGNVVGYARLIRHLRCEVEQNRLAAIHCQDRRWILKLSVGNSLPWQQITYSINYCNVKYMRTITDQIVSPTYWVGMLKQNTAKVKGSF